MCACLLVSASTQCSPIHVCVLLSPLSLAPECRSRLDLLRITDNLTRVLALTHGHVSALSTCTGPFFVLSSIRVLHLPPRSHGRGIDGHEHR